MELQAAKALIVLVMAVSLGLGAYIADRILDWWDNR